MNLYKKISFAPVQFCLVLLLLISIGCKEEAEIGKNTENEKSTAYSIEPVDITNVRITDKFWLPVIQTVQNKTIDYAIEKIKEEGRLDNFLMAGGKIEGEVKGEMPFDDTDVYKIIEGASYSLVSAPNEALSTAIDTLINIIKIGQEKDGYLTTWRTINPAKPPASWVEVHEGKRWESLDRSHELYNAGHLYEAAVAHYQATGKRTFLEIAIKNADLMVKTFGDEEGKISTVPGHQIIETGLIKLYEVTGKTEYFDLAKYFLDNRGNPENHELFGEYSQDHLPVTQQKEAVGHAVRAVYMYAAMTDVAAIEQDSAYFGAVNSLWDNMVNKKTYVTGGIGAKHEGEAFGENYELPNLSAYNETCASIGNVYWNHRLHNLSGDVKYFDVIERTLYNGLISGLSLDGTNFFYPNPLESDGTYKFNQGACTRKGWFDCSCCPTNLIRFIPSIPSLIYSKSKDAIYVNLYASNSADINLDNEVINISQETNYPWKGKVKIGVNPTKNTKFTLKLRVPSWSRNEVMPGNLYDYVNDYDLNPEITLNGERVEHIVENGYISMNREWNPEDKIEISFPMEVRKVKADSRVIENNGKVAIEYGPIVYAFEEIDNKTNFDALSVTPTNSFVIKKEDSLLHGINTLNFQGFKGIPYYAWSNRGIGKMKVWLPYKE